VVLGLSDGVNYEVLKGLSVDDIVITGTDSSSSNNSNSPNSTPSSSGGKGK
jgi:hypothetical protein